MLLIKLEGTPYEMGRQTGKAYPLAVWRVAAERMKAFHTGNCDMAALDKQIGKRTQEVADTMPEAYDYLRGLAEGSTAPLRNLIMIGLGRDINPEKGGCSIAGFQDTPQGPVVGGNLDDPSWQYLSFEKPATGYAALFVSLPGYFIKWGGMNEHGLCITGSSAATAKTRTDAPKESGRRTPVEVGPVGDVLQKCRTVDEALELMRDSRYSANNHMLGDPETVAQVEGRCEHVWREPDDAPLCVGNLRRSEFEQEGFERIVPLLPKYLQNHAARNALLTSLMTERLGNGSAEAMKEVLSSHGDKAGNVRARISICNIATSVSLVGVPIERRVFVSSAPACVNGYTEYRLDDLEKSS